MQMSDAQILLFLGSGALAYGLVAWVTNLRRGEDLRTSLTHGPALLVLLLMFVLFVGGGTWLIGLLTRVLFGA